MSVYDFNIPKNNINVVIEKLREELNTIVVNSQSNINELTRRILLDEKQLNELKNLVNKLPDYTSQYEELRAELQRIKIQLQNLVDHPIDLDTIDISTAGGISTEVQKINGQYIYAEHSVNDISGRPIIDTYATKNELSHDISSISTRVNTLIENEKIEREAADTAVLERVEAERLEREMTDNVLSSSIDTEKLERIESDNFLLEQIQEAGIAVDSELDSESRNPVENRAINEAFINVGAEIDTKQNILTEMSDDEINNLIESLEDL